MSETTMERCPRCKCVAEATTSVGTVFVCGSIAFADDGIVQSRKCTASQRDQLADEVRRLKALLADRDEASACAVIQG